MPVEEAPFVVSRKVYRLVWPEGSDYAGLVVRARSLPMGLFLELAPQIDALSGLQPSDLTAENTENILAPLRMLGRHLVSWNLQDEVDGELHPVPATFEGLISQDADLILAIVQAWVQAAGVVPAPLGPPSSPGASDDDDLAASMAMTTLPEM